MKDYPKCSLRENPEQFIRRVGTNDLNTERSPKIMAKSIADLATTLKGDSGRAGVSNIIAGSNNITRYFLN